MILAELVVDTGLPNGVLNVIHGTNDIVNAICDDDDIEVVSFVGPDAAQLYMRGRPFANNSKGAKGHGAQQLTLVFVGGSKLWEDKLAECAKVLKVNAGTVPGAGLRPVISKQVKERISKQLLIVEPN